MMVYGEWQALQEIYIKAKVNKVETNEKNLLGLLMHPEASESFLAAEKDHISFLNWHMNNTIRGFHSKILNFDQKNSENSMIQMSINVMAQAGLTNTLKKLRAYIENPEKSADKLPSTILPVPEFLEKYKVFPSNMHRSTHNLKKFLNSSVEMSKAQSKDKDFIPAHELMTEAFLVEMKDIAKFRRDNGPLESIWKEWKIGHYDKHAHDGMKILIEKLSYQ